MHHLHQFDHPPAGWMNPALRAQKGIAPKDYGINLE
jgi:hypothetical protein